MASESRYSRTPDGAIWTVDGLTYRFFTRYLSVFDAVRVLARARDVPTAPTDARRVDGPDIDVWPVPYYIGPRGYLRHRTAIQRAARTAADHDDAVILRAPTPIGNLLATTRERLGLPYAVEVIGDPYDVFAPGVVEHPLRPLLRQWGRASLRRRCRTATAVAYVTEQALQARYPADPDARTAAYSSVELSAEAFVRQPRDFRTGLPGGQLISVGGLDQPYKGIDTLLYAIALRNTRHPPLRLTHIGDGRHRSQLEHLASQLGISHQITFTGALPAGDPIRHRLDQADLFVMPSRTEGLPRALIEAMARALPAIASRVGGIPELLPPEYLIPPDNPTALANAITQLLDDPTAMTSASGHNLARARDYSIESLTPRRDAFYRTLRQATIRYTEAAGRTS